MCRFPVAFGSIANNRSQSVHYSSRKTNRYIEIEDDGTVKAVMTVGTNNYLTLNVGNDKQNVNSKSSI